MCAGSKPSDVASRSRLGRCIHLSIRLSYTFRAIFKFEEILKLQSNLPHKLINEFMEGIS